MINLLYCFDYIITILHCRLLTPRLLCEEEKYSMSLSTMTDRSKADRTWLAGRASDHHGCDGWSSLLYCQHLIYGVLRDELTNLIDRYGRMQYTVGAATDSLRGVQQIYRSPKMKKYGQNKYKIKPKPKWSGFRTYLNALQFPCCGCC